MSLADRSTFKRRLDSLGVTVTEGPEAACIELVNEAAGDPAVGVPLGRAGRSEGGDVSVSERAGAGVSLPERVDTDPTAAELRAAHTGVTDASLGVAEYGSVAIEADAEGTEPISLFVDRHVVVLREADLVPDMPDAFAWLGPRSRDDGVDVVFATGPSATADMGGLVHGAHGPKEVHVVLLTDGAEKSADAADTTETEDVGTTDE